VACRAIDSRGELTRLAMSEGRLVVDQTGAMPGRGGWIHARKPCVDRLATAGRGGLARSLRREVSGADVMPVTREMQSWLANTARKL
jgi:predicted RNA-binding protein YlxR (DUF448 family)